MSYREEQHNQSANQYTKEAASSTVSKVFVEMGLEWINRTEIAFWCQTQTHYFFFVVSIASFVGLAVQLAYLNAGNGRGFVPSFVSGIWITSLTLFYAVEGVLTMHVPFHLGSTNIGWMAMNVMLIFTAFLLAVGYFLALCINGVYGGPTIGAGIAGGCAIGGLLPTVIVYFIVCFQVRNGQPIDLAQDLLSDRESSNTVKLPTSCWRRWCTTLTLIYVNNVVKALAFSLTFLLLGGCWFQAIGYHIFPPDGTFYTITLPNGQMQDILTRCTGDRNASLPTLWMEVGGGGHSMSDLCGLQNYFTDNYNRRYCSYDMPGTGWSSDVISGQPYITEQVIQAMDEPGPFIMMGTMDGGDVRAYQYALNHPENVVAVVPIVMSGVGEFDIYGDFNGLSAQDTEHYAKSTLYSRMTMGNAINFFGVSWGLIAAFAPPSPGYVPQSQSLESVFLNIYNERQWATNCNYLYQGSKDPYTAGFLGDSLWLTNSSLHQTIPVIAFDQFYSEQDIANNCDGHPVSNCLFAYSRNITMSTYHTVINRNPTINKLVLCTSCNATSANAFLVDQEGNIPWFADTLMELIGDITLPRP